MTIFSLELGNDRIGGLRRYTMEVNGGFSLQELAANFDKNVTRFGYDPANVTNDSVEFPTDLLLRVAEAGMVIATPDGYAPLFYNEEYEDGIASAEQVAQVEADGDVVYASLDGMLAFLMFLVGYDLAGYGLDGFSWSFAQPENLLDLASSTKDHAIAVALVEEYAAA